MSAPRVRGAHLDTVLPALFSAPRVPGPVEALWVDVGPGTAVRVDVTAPRGPRRGTILLLHGMTGSAESPYVRRSSLAALDRGWCVARMNLRGCGGTESRSRTFYNAAQHGDVGLALEALASAKLPAPRVAMGFSLGGNLALLHAGLAGRETAADAIVAVNAPVDLDACSRALARGSNRAYDLFFVALLCAHVRRIRRHRPVPGPPASAWRIRTLRRFDDRFTAPDGGWASVEAYYAEASAGPRLRGIRVPCLIVSAKNDPFVPVSMYDAFPAPPGVPVRRLHPERGGHVGYRTPGGRRFWAADAALDFLAEPAAAVAGARARG